MNPQSSSVINSPFLFLSKQSPAFDIEPYPLDGIFFRYVYENGVRLMSLEAEVFTRLHDPIFLFQKIQLLFSQFDKNI